MKSNIASWASVGDNGHDTDPYAPPKASTTLESSANGSRSDKRSRLEGALMLCLVPFLLFLGAAGAHGGGWGTGFAVIMALASAPVGLGTLVIGVSKHTGSFGRKFAWFYLLTCLAAIIAALVDLTT